MVRSGLTALAFSLLALSACGDNGHSGADRDLASFDEAAIRALVERGQYRRAIEVIQFQEDQRIADAADYMLAAEVYLDLLDGVAAQVYLEKAMGAGVPINNTSLMMARALLLQRKFEAARSTIEQTTAASVDEYEAALLRGDIERELDQPDEARYYYLLAIDINPDDFRGYLALSMLSLGLGDLAAAENQAAKSASLVDDDTLIRYVRGTVARYSGRPDDAVRHLERALELHEANLHALFELIGLKIDLDRIPEAEQHLQRLYELVPESFMARYFSAVLLAKQGQMEEAEYLMLRTGDLTQQYPPAGRVYGHLAFALGKYLTAQPYLATFLSKVPQDRLTRLALAESYTRRGAPERALEVLSVLLASNANDLEAYLQAAAAEGALGNIRGARHYFETAYRFASQRPEIEQRELRQLGRRLALARFMTGEIEQAKAQLQQMYGEDGNDIDSLTLLFNLHLQEGELDKAADIAEKISAKTPGSALSANLRGTLEARRGNHEAAITFFNAALAINPRYLSALKNRAAELVGLERYEQAKEDLLFLEEAAPSDAQVKALLGRTFFELGEPSQAISRLREAEDALPGSAIVKADYAEALAESGFSASALAKARQAMSLAADSPGLQDYLQTMIDGWVAAEEGRKRRNQRNQRNRR